MGFPLGSETDLKVWIRSLKRHCSHAVIAVTVALLQRQLSSESPQVWQPREKGVKERRGDKNYPPG